MSDDKIYLSDKTQKIITVYSQQWQKITTLDVSQMQAPGLLLKHDASLIVLDEQSSKLHLFDTDKMVETQVIKLPDKEVDSHYLDMSAMNEYLYITLQSPNMSDAQIVVINLKTGETQKLQHQFVGFVFSDKQTTYFVNSMVANAEGFQGGISKLFLLENNSLSEKGELIEGSLPSDFIVDGEEIYVYTSGWSSIDRYSLKLNYLDSIAIFKQGDIESVLKGNKTHLYLLMRNEQKLYEVKRK